MSNHKSTKSALKNLDKSSNSFGANTKNNPKEECKAVMTRSKKFVEAEDEESVGYKEKMGEKTGAEVKENDVNGKKNQEKGKKIMVQNKEMENQEKETNFMENRFCSGTGKLNETHRILKEIQNLKIKFRRA